MQAQTSNAWLWQDTRWSDFRMDVLTDEDSAPLYSLPLHSLVLAGASPGHFRGHCNRLKEQVQSPVQPDEQQAKRAKHTQLADEHEPTEPSRPTALPATPAPAPFQYRLTLFPGEPEGVPKAVLCHLYTGALPDDPEQLIWMLRRADYLDLADTVHAVSRKLIAVGSKQLTLQHAAQLSRLPAIQCSAQQTATAVQPAAAGAPAPALAKTAAAQLLQLMDSLLLAHLPSAPAIVTDAALLAQFTQLPLALVRRWVKLDKYEVDSGTTLAVLFTAWHDAQPEPPTEQQCKQLSALLPLAAVSLCFHTQALQKLKWWRAPSILGLPALEAHVYAQQCHMSTERWHSRIRGASVVARAHARSSYEWTVSAAQLKQLWEEKELALPCFYFAGQMLGLPLVLHKHEQDAGVMVLDLRTVLQWPDALKQHTALSAYPVDAMVATLVYGFSVGPYQSKACKSWKDNSSWQVGGPAMQFRSVQQLAPDPAITFNATLDVVLVGPAGDL